MAVTDLIRQRQQQEQKTEVITLRIPCTELGRIDELAFSLDVTRQRLLTEIINEGVQNALDELLKAFEREARNPDNETEEEPNGARFFILNTNKANDPDTHHDMLNNGTAAAFLDPWKFKIERLKKGDVVFLYESGVGIVATGIASGNVEKLEYEGKPEEQYRQKLNKFRRVKPINARDIKKVVGENLIFLQTLFKIPAAYGNKISKHLEDV